MESEEGKEKEVTMEIAKFSAHVYLAFGICLLFLGFILFSVVCFYLGVWSLLMAIEWGKEARCLRVDSIRIQHDYLKKKYDYKFVKDPNKEKH